LNPIELLKEVLLLTLALAVSIPSLVSETVLPVTELPAPFWI
jgi:hypothetical protein